jgi:hypothetical protein
MFRVFSEHQPEYAARGLATFPIDPIEKRPCVRHYDRIGLRGSQQLRLNLHDAAGIACTAGKRNRLTVLDIDAAGKDGERLFIDAIARYGTPRIAVRTANGKFHGYYRHNGEPRLIRPDNRTPVDILGAGVVVLPPSVGATGRYQFIEGCLDDFDQLEYMRAPVEPLANLPHGHGRLPNLRAVQIGERDKTLYRMIALICRTALTFDAALTEAQLLNEMLPSPLTDSEINAKARYWWRKTQSGENRIGNRGPDLLDHEANLMLRQPDAFLLLRMIRLHHVNTNTFVLANAWSDCMPGGRWTRKRFAAARARLIAEGWLTVEKPAGRSRPMSCRLSAPKADN